MNIMILNSLLTNLSNGVVTFVLGLGIVFLILIFRFYFLCYAVEFLMILFLLKLFLLFFVHANHLRYRITGVKDFYESQHAIFFFGHIL